MNEDREPLEFFIAAGLNGLLDPMGIRSAEAYCAARKLAPETKGSPTQPLCAYFYTESDELAEATKKIAEIYRNKVADQSYDPGPFGDILRILRIGSHLFCITEIVHQAFPKAAQAADIIPIIKCRTIQGEDQFFVLFGTRKHEPGEGGNAAFGGFISVGPKDAASPPGLHNPYIVDSDLYTALKEGREEANLQIEIPNIEALREQYDLNEVEGVIHCGVGDNASSLPVKIVRLAKLATSELPIAQGGEVLKSGEKRVFTVTGFACFFDVNEIVGATEEDRAALLKHLSLFPADGEMGQLRLLDITCAALIHDEASIAEFELRAALPIPHHRHLVRLALDKLRQHYQLY